MLLKSACLSLIGLAACAEADREQGVSEGRLESAYLIDRIVEDVLARDPAIVNVNEVHEAAHYTRYVSACVMEGLGRRTQIDLFGAESFSISGRFDPTAESSDGFRGRYGDYPHFADLIFVAGRQSAHLFGYDPRTSEYLSAEALAQRNLANNFINRRDRLAAERILSTRGPRPSRGLTFLHVGGQHGMKDVYQRPGEAMPTAWLGGQLGLLGESRVVTLVQNINYAQRIPCTGDGDARAYDLGLGEAYCVREAARFQRGFDVFLRNAALQSNENGFITEAIPGCAVRKPVRLVPPPTEAGFDAVSWRVSIRQRIGYGQRSLTWMGEFVPGETAVFLLDTPTADLTWVARDRAGQTQTMAVRDLTLEFVE